MAEEKNFLDAMTLDERRAVLNSLRGALSAYQALLNQGNWLTGEGGARVHEEVCRIKGELSRLGSSGT